MPDQIRTFKTLLLIPFLALAITGLWSQPGNASSVPVTLQVIDGTGDWNTTVTVLAAELGTGRLVYFTENTNEWRSVPLFSTFEGGTVIQFGLDTQGTIEPEIQVAELDFLVRIDASYAQKPTDVTEDYYGLVLMDWDYGRVSLGVAGKRNCKDGYRLVPIPGTAWVLGGLCLAYLGVGRRRRKILNARALTPSLALRSAVLMLAGLRKSIMG